MKFEKAAGNSSVKKRAPVMTLQVPGYHPVALPVCLPARRSYSRTQTVGPIQSQSPGVLRASRIRENCVSAENTVLKILQARGASRQDSEFSEPDDTEGQFTVQLQKGPRGLGLGLIDGLVRSEAPRFRVRRLIFFSLSCVLLQYTSLGKAGIYVRTLVPGEPAEIEGSLKLGDKILAVNGESVVNSSYQRCVLFDFDINESIEQPRNRAMCTYCQK